MTNDYISGQLISVRNVLLKAYEDIPAGVPSNLVETAVLALERIAQELDPEAEIE